MLLLLFVPRVAMAEIPAYALVPEKSSLTFTAIQNGAPVEGEFKRLTADIRFDPAQLEQSSVAVEVDLASVAAAYENVASELQKGEWFDVAHFPKAVVRTTKITQVTPTAGEANLYYADATLTLRDKTLPVVINFSLPRYTPEEAIAEGRVTLLRTAFGVGQGEWKNTDAVKDEVMVRFRVVAARSK